MAESEKKPKTITHADGTPATVHAAKEVGNPTPYRIGAVIAWVIAIACEVLAILFVLNKIPLAKGNPLVVCIIFLVVDLACVIAGSLCWKKANHIDPASKKNKVKFWLWNNMGLIVCAFAFIPFIVIVLTNKEADKKTKTIAAVAAAVALAIGSLFSVDWNPISEEEKAEAIEEFGDTEVFWTKSGGVYHTSTECGHLYNSTDLIVGSVEQAIAEGKTRICKSCEARDAAAAAEQGADEAGEPAA